MTNIKLSTKKMYVTYPPNTYIRETIEFYLKLKEELVKYGGLSKSLIPKQLLTSLMVGRDMLVLPTIPL